MGFFTLKEKGYPRFSSNDYILNITEILTNFQYINEQNINKYW